MIALDLKKIPEYYKNAFAEGYPKDYYKQVIRNSFKFINLVKEVITLNDKEEAQVTVFRGLSTSTLNHAKVGNTYRFMSFQSSSENSKVVCRKFMKDESEVSFIKVTRPIECKNTSKFYTEASLYEDEKEWLTQPYSTFILDKKIKFNMKDPNLSLKEIKDKKVISYIKKEMQSNDKDNWETLTY